MKTQGADLGLHRGDGVFQRGIFANDEALCLHGGAFFRRYLLYFL